jgi:hypothetical protein
MKIIRKHVNKLKILLTSYVELSKSIFTEGYKMSNVNA